MKIFGKKKHENRKADEIERFSKELKDARIHFTELEKLVLPFRGDRQNI